MCQPTLSGEACIPPSTLARQSAWRKTRFCLANSLECSTLTPRLSHTTSACLTHLCPQAAARRDTPSVRCELRRSQTSSLVVTSLLSPLRKSVSRLDRAEGPQRPPPLPAHPPSHTAEGRLSVRRATRIQRRMSALSCLGLGMVSCLPLYSLRARERECPWGCRHGDFGSPCVGAGRGQRLVDGGLSCGEQPRVPWHHTPW